MFFTLCVIACVQIGYRYFAKSSSSEGPSSEEPSGGELEGDVADRDAAESSSPLVVQNLGLDSPTSRNPHGIAISVASLGLAILSGRFPLRLLSTGVISYTVAPIHAKAWKKWTEERKINNDTLFSLFSILALVGRFNTPVAFGFVAYELGSYLLLKTTAQTQKLTFDSFSQLPRSVWLLKDGVEIQVPLSVVKVGDIVAVNGGEMVPVDGQVVKGRALIDQHLLTGEAQPAEKEVGDWVLASTLVTAGGIQVKIAKMGTDTNVAQITRTLTEIAQTKTEVQSRGEQLADRIAVPILALGGVALLTSGLSMAVVVLNSSFGNRIRVLGPLSTLNYLTIAARRGILVKGGTALEQIARIDTVLFDKTGTLTLPQLRTGPVTTYHGYHEQEILAYAAAAERRQEHPIAKAILQTARELRLDVPECDETSYRIGYGVRVKLADDRLIRVGNVRFMEMEDIVRPEQMVRDVVLAQEAGESLVVVAIDDRVVGTIIIQAQVRPEVSEIIAGLRKRGVEHLAIVSGDHTGPTRRLADSLTINDYFAEVLPTDKAGIVRNLQDQGRVVCFIGDGVNDSVAMQQADVSISLSGASTIATDSASIVLMDGSLKHLCELFDIAKKLDANTRRSLAILSVPAAINVGGAFLGLGVGGSVLLKALGSLIAIGNSALPLLEQQKSEVQVAPEESNPPPWTSGHSTAVQAS
jgi:heavy metal translocating P-type ATPase